jgi:RNA polymerase sigma factor (sigma-70 family)
MQELKSLIANAQSGDVEAYDELVRGFQDVAVAYGYSLLGDLHWAEDAAQEALIEAFYCLPSLQEGMAFPSWLRRIVLKQCDRIMRKRQVSWVTLDAASQEVCPDDQPQSVAEKNELGLQVRNAIATLPEHERTVTLLFYMGQHSQHQIAEFLEVPVTTVKKRLHTARKRLKEKMIEMVKEDLQEQRPSQDTRFAQQVKDVLAQRVVEPNTPEWDVAVENKRQRDFAMVEQDGIARQEIEQRYEAYRRDKGIAFHDERLRQQTADGQLLTWWHSDVMVAYASVQTARLLGLEDHGVTDALDVCVHPGLSQAFREQIVNDLLQYAREKGTPHLQISCDHELADANLNAGGKPVKYYFQFNVKP